MLHSQNGYPTTYSTPPIEGFTATFRPVWHGGCGDHMLPELPTAWGKLSNNLASDKEAVVGGRTCDCWPSLEYYPIYTLQELRYSAGLRVKVLAALS